MSTFTNGPGIVRIILGIALLLVMLPCSALASGPSWRPTYDQIMLYVNFLILAGVVFKFGREPIKNFLQQQKNDVLAEINALEAEKDKMISEIKSADAQVAENRERLAETKARLIAQGENKKQQIIEDARSQSALMLEAARRKMEYRIVQAREKLKAELADLAFEAAKKQLPQVITDADNQRLFDLFLSKTVKLQGK